MAVIPFDPGKRRPRPAARRGTGPAKILRLDRLSDGVLLRVIHRAGQREMERWRYVYELTKGEPDILPSQAQMEEMENGFIEF